MRPQALLPHIAAIVLATTLVSGSALAQQAPESGRCDETTKRLDRELEDLSERLAGATNAQGKPRAVPTTRILVELMEMVALQEHLRCLGLRPEVER